MEEKQIGIVSNYFDHVTVAAVKLSGALSVGNTIRIVGGDSDFEQEVDSIQIQHSQVKSAKAGDEIGIKVAEKVRKGYKVYKV